MDATFLSLHKAKHLSAHVLVVAGARRWPHVLLGESGETAAGFNADFSLTEPSDEIECVVPRTFESAELHNCEVPEIAAQLLPRPARCPR